MDSIGEVCLQILSIPTFIHQQYEATLKQNDHFKLIVHGIEIHTAFQERENKQKKAKF